MLSLLVTTTLLCGVADGTAQKDAAAELAGLADQLTKVESYKFTSKSESDGGGFGGGARGGDRGGRGGEGAGQGGGQGGREGGGERRGGGQARGGQARGGQQPQAIEGLWKVGQPMQVTVGDAVAYKDGEQVVYADADGNWTVYEAPARGQGRGRQGRGGAGGGQGRGERGGEGGDRPERGQRGEAPDREAMRAMRAMRSVVGVTAPHQQFKGFAALVSDVEKTAADAMPATEDAKATPAKMTYTGKLTEAGTDAFGAIGGFAGRGGRGGAGGGRGDFQMETSGTFTIEVVAGAIARAEFAITRSGSFGEREFERTTKRIYTFSDAGKVKLEVPEDALALFEI